MDKVICAKCIKDEFLKAHVAMNGEFGECEFCEKPSNTISLNKLSELIDEAFDRHYKLEFPEPPDYEQFGEESKYAIMNAAGIPEDAAELVREILEEEYYDFNSAASGEAIHFSSDMFYSERNIEVDELEREWYDFANTLKTEARFFNSKGYDLLNNIFRGLDELETIGSTVPISNAGPEMAIEYLYRARVFQSNKKLEAALINPDIELGPPPASLAAPGRMNANGISVFYGSLNSECAVSEVRPPVGSEVVVAKFRLIRNVRLLDLTALPNVSPKGSIFDPVFSEKLRNLNFLRELGQMMSVPVLPDHQSNEFLVTQAIADFLASNSALNLDGIVYPSVQHKKLGKNVILFHKSAKVVKLERPANVEITASSRDSAPGEGLYWNSYTVTETSILNEHPSTRARRHWETYHTKEDSVFERSKPTLEIEIDSIRVHEIQSVSYTNEIQTVNWHKNERDESLYDDMPF